MPDPGSARHALNSVLALARVSLLVGLQYRSDFFFDALTGIVRTAATAAPLWVVYAHADTILGWSKADAGLVLALFLLLQGLVAGLLEPNLGMVVEAIRDGSLDLVLVRPADAQLLVSLRSVAPGRIWDLLGAALVAAWALPQLPPPTALDIAVAISMLLAGFASMYSLWLLAICTSFFFVRVDNLRHLLDSAMGAGRWPITVFTPWVRWALTLLLPVGLLTSFPVMALRGDWDAWLIVTAWGVALAFVMGSRRAWTASLSAYTSASS